MNCEHAGKLLDAFIDGELDAATDATLSAHLAGCAACAARREARDALRIALRRLPPRAASAGLRRAVRRELDLVTDRFAGRGWHWWEAGGLAAAAAVLAFVVGFALRLPGGEARWQDRLVAAHAAALADSGGKLDVVASDRHAVKPWFAGRLDFAPTVRDLDAEGFQLLGARIEPLDPPAAVVVYRIRNHRVEVFMWRATTPRDADVALHTVRGFGVARWAGRGLEYLAVSDVDPGDLERLARALLHDLTGRPRTPPHISLSQPPSTR